jgi:hypothetical protein
MSNKSLRCFQLFDFIHISNCLEREVFRGLYLQPVEKELVVPDMDLDLDLSDMGAYVQVRGKIFQNS